MALIKQSTARLCCALMCTAAVLFTGCKSTDDNVPTRTHGATAGDGYTYGTGPNKTKPYPQSDPVKIEGVPGAKPKYEALSRGGNKDYTVLGQNYMVWKNCNSYLEVGTASWYGPGFHGNKTSNGETYDQRGFSAAHKNLPLPSYVKVTNLENGKTVIVRVNDRGPFHGSRIIDLSEGAAKAINMTGKGTAKVKLELISVRGASNVTGGDGRTDGKVIGQAIANAVIGGIVDKALTESGIKRNINNADNISKLVDELESGNVSGSTLKNATASAIDVAKQADRFVSSISTPAQASTSATTTTTTTTSTTSTSATTSTTGGYMGNPQAAEVTYSEFAQSVSGTVPTSATVNYQVTYATPEEALLPGKAYVQVFSTVSAQKAEQIRARLKSSSTYDNRIVSDHGLNRVMLGPVPESDLSVTLEYMKQLGYGDAFIKRMP